MGCRWRPRSGLHRDVSTPYVMLSVNIVLDVHKVVGRKPLPSEGRRDICKADTNEEQKPEA